MVFWGWYGGAREVTEGDLSFYVLASQLRGFLFFANR